MLKWSDTMVKNWNDIMAAAAKGQSRKVVVAGADDPHILQALQEAEKLGMVEPLVVSAGFDQLSTTDEIRSGSWPMVDAAPDEIGSMAVSLVKENPGALLMKGSIPTAQLIKAVLNRQTGIRTTERLSHVVAVETPGYAKLLYVTDGGINLRPDQDTLEIITRNAVEFVKTLGIAEPRTALITLIEKVNPQINSTVKAAEVVKRCAPEMIIEGPVSIDIALSPAAAAQKNFNSRISGEVDIMVMPTATACNVAVKFLRLAGAGRIGGVVLGAQVPIILVSRSDDANSKLRSIGLAMLYQNRRT